MLPATAASLTRDKSRTRRIMEEEKEEKDIVLEPGDGNESGFCCFVEFG